MKVVHVFDKDTHNADSPCPQKWFWCRVHWWPRFGDSGDKWHGPYPLTVNRKTEDYTWVSTQVHCGPGTFYPKPANNRSYSK